MIQFYNISIKHMLISVFIFAITFLIGNNSYAQHIDKEVHAEIILSEKAWSNNDTALALQYAQKAVKLSDDDNGLTRAIASNQLADILRNKKQFKKSFDLYYSAYLLLQDETIIDNEKAQLNIIKSITGIGYLFNKIGAWDRALNSLTRLPDSYSPTFGNNYPKTKRIIIDCSIKKEKYIEAIAVCDELISNNIEIEYAYSKKSESYVELIKFDKAIDNERKLIEIYKNKNETHKINNSELRIANWYGQSNNDNLAIEIYSNLLANKDIKSTEEIRIKYLLAKHYTSINKFNKAELLIKDIVENNDSINNEITIKTYNLWITIPFYLTKYQQAYNRLQKHKSKFNQIANDRLRLLIYISANSICEKANKISEAYTYLKKSNELKIRILKNEQAEQIANYNLQLQVDLFSNKIISKRIKYEFEKQIEQKHNYKEGEEKAELRNDKLLRSRQIMAAFILLGFIIFYIGYRAYKKRKILLLEIEKSHNLLSEKNKDIEQKSTELEIKNKETQEALKQIRNMQDQLIESQRLASLGQVTAGIAHEIRNPLNFVTNFATLIIELLDDLEEIVENKIELLPREDFDEVHEILSMINSNAEKIHTHGERASSIITNMLDVSRKNNNAYTSEPLNKIIKDSTELAFEGVKGNIPSFDVNLSFDFDDNINNIPIMKQDISRVFINLISNSCQAIEPKLQHDKDFFGKIKITTKLIENNVQIIITDNGSGISDKVMKNIFTPFFTTKDSGKGTGLGLTMTYDIITKLHKGKITVDSKEGEFTSFIIEIPTNLKS